MIPMPFEPGKKMQLLREFTHLHIQPSYQERNRSHWLLETFCGVKPVLAKIRVVISKQATIWNRLLNIANSKISQTRKMSMMSSQAGINRSLRSARCCLFIHAKSWMAPSEPNSTDPRTGAKWSQMVPDCLSRAKCALTLPRGLIGQ